VSNSKSTTLTLIRWGGAAAISGGLSYAAAGYLDRPGISGYISALVLVLGVATPAFFLGGLVGLGSRLLLGGELSYVRETGFVLGCLGTMVGLVYEVIHTVIHAVGLEQNFWGLHSVRIWWLALLFAGLTLIGMVTLLKEELRRLGALVLTSGLLGLGSSLTDSAFSGVLVPIRTAHVFFAALFCLSAIMWGWMLFREVS
jgi:hypothetical protein